MNLDFIIHIDKQIGNIISYFGNGTYFILFAIIFAETGLVVIPFLPGDSLLFAVGALAGGGFLNVIAGYLTMLIAAILGDSVNYWLGNKIGHKVFNKENSRFFNKEHLEKTRRFYEKYGGKTIILARFIPIVRTFAPFVAGVGKMHYRTFINYNIIGAFLWVTFFTYAGYFFGGMEIIKNNFEYAVVLIVLLSLVPMAFEYIRYKFAPVPEKADLKNATFKDLKETFKKERLND